MDGNASPMAAEEPHVADPELPARPNVARVTVTIDPGHAPVWRVADQGGIWDDDDIDAARRVGDQWDVGDGDEDIDGDYDEDIDAGVGADDDAYAYGGFGAVPASGDAVAALPVPETTVGEGEATEEECAVCLEAYEAGDTLRTMPCSHGFHEHCIFGWLAISRLCPLCRFALPAAEF
ncbi:unnamed protein product [Urochloa decumbens]|uniref:RING-type domain-containing protein n=1 Tax=Urochloa decumbens TaxID=240449 RepID=A0ABC9H6N9_9POAL